MSSCTECQASGTDLLINSPDVEFPFIQNVFCRICNKSFVNCERCGIFTPRICERARKKDYFKIHQKMHALSGHGINVPTDVSTGNDTLQASSSVPSNIPEVDFGSASNENESNSLYQMFLDCGQTFGSQSSEKYLKILLEHDTMSLQNVVETSLSNNLDSFPGSLDKSSTFYKNLIHLHVVTSIWVNKMSKSNRQYFCSFISQLKKCFPDSVGVNAYLPNEYKDLRSLYFDGKNSVISKIPHPKINTKDGYSYVLISDILLDLFTFKLKTSNMPNSNESLSYIKSLNSKYLDDILENNRILTSSSPVIFILLQLWSDGFDPNGVKKTEMVFGYIH